MQQTTGDPTAKAVLLAIAESADSSGNAYPSQQRIAESLELSLRAVRDAIVRLRDRGFLDSTARGRRGKKGRSSNHYHLHLPAAGAGYQPAGSAGKSDLEAAGADKPEHLPAAGAGASSTKTEPEENKPPVVPLQAPPTQNGKRSRRCPPDFTPTDDHRRLAIELGVDFGLELAKMRDHEFDKPKSDWSATLRNWIRTAAERRPKRPASSGPHLSTAQLLATVPADDRPYKTRMQIEHERRKAAGE